MRCFKRWELASGPDMEVALSCLELRLFDGFVLSRGDGAEVSVPLVKERALLAYLTLNAGKHLTRSHLAGLLWGEQSEKRARHSLSQSLSSLCRRLGSAAGLVHRDRQAITLQKNAFRVDVETFNAWSASSNAADLRRAVEIYREDLFSEFDFGEPRFDDWARALRSGCHDRVMQAGIAYLAGETEGREISDRLAVAHRLLRLDPCSETVHQALIRLYIEAGQTGAAVRQFEAVWHYLHSLDTMPGLQRSGN